MKMGPARYFMPEESPVWGAIAAEAFRDTTFGMIDVRILESGRRGASLGGLKGSEISGIRMSFG